MDRNNSSIQICFCHENSDRLFPISIFCAKQINTLWEKPKSPAQGWQRPPWSESSAASCGPQLQPPAISLEGTLKRTPMPAKMSETGVLSGCCVWTVSSTFHFGNPSNLRIIHLLLSVFFYFVDQCIVAFCWLVGLNMIISSSYRHIISIFFLISIHLFQAFSFLLNTTGAYWPYSSIAKNVHSISPSSIFTSHRREWILYKYENISYHKLQIFFWPRFKSGGKLILNTVCFPQSIFGVFPSSVGGELLSPVGFLSQRIFLPKAN